jgi:hypothetical protein
MASKGARLELNGCKQPSVYSPLLNLPLGGVWIRFELEWDSVHVAVDLMEMFWAVHI